MATLQQPTTYALLIYKLDNMKSRENEGQRGRLPVQALGYVNSAKVSLGLPKTAGVRFRYVRAIPFLR